MSLELCTKQAILELIDNGEMAFEPCEAVELAFLDDIRLGLRLGGTLAEVRGPVDLSGQNPTPYHMENSDGAAILPGKRYVCASREKLRIPKNLICTIHTRSRYAQQGLELVHSSNIVLPGFGSDKPHSLLFEITSPLELRNLNTACRYGYLLLYRLPFGVCAGGHPQTPGCPRSWFEE